MDDVTNAHGAPIPIVALDVQSAGEAMRIVARLGDSCDFYKVGGELFTAEGPSIVRALRDRGAEVFLDLKFHDIPNTVRQACRSAAKLGARLLTVHATGGDAMLRAAVEGAGESCAVLAVTVLTSSDAGDVAAAWGRSAVDVEAEVLRLAGLAHHAGARGVVCSGREAEAVGARFGGALRTLVPGVRFADGAAHDQARVVTPAEARRVGASWVVLGRAVTGASDPAEAMARARAELGAVV